MLKKLLKIKKLPGVVRMKISYTDQEAIENRYLNVFGKKPNLTNPQTFNEKITWIISNYRNPLYAMCSDKVSVREYVAAAGLKHILTNVYAVYDDIRQINFDQLPEKFVIKTTHSSGGVCVVNGKSSADYMQIKRILSASLKTNLYKSSREWQYKDLQPRIIAEELIGQGATGPLMDFKFFCFDGKPKFIYVAEDTASGGDYAVDFYDINWKHLDAQRIGHRSHGPIPRPKHLSKMLEIARALSKGFPHVRVDLYDDGKKVYFGELTFTTAVGLGQFTDEKWDYEFGSYFKLPTL